MSIRIYAINKGVNKPLVFKGLKGQYVLYLAIGLVGLLLSFSILFIAGVPPAGCIGIVLVAGGTMFYYVSRLSKRYGQYGLMKHRAASKIPTAIRSKTRKVFMSF